MEPSPLTAQSQMGHSKVQTSVQQKQGISYAGFYIVSAILTRNSLVQICYTFLNVEVRDRSWHFRYEKQVPNAAIFEVIAPVDSFTCLTSQLSTLCQGNAVVSVKLLAV